VVATRYKRPESVLVVVYARDGDVLLLERVAPPGYWQSVTGSLRWGETPAPAARRELQEETGLVADDALVDCGLTNHFPILPAWRGRYHPQVTVNTEHVYRLELPAPTAVRLNSGEHRDLCWLSRQAAARLVSSHTNRDAILSCVPGP